MVGYNAIQLVKWSTTGSVMAMVVDYQLYYVDALDMDKMVKVMPEMEDGVDRRQGVANLLYEGEGSKNNLIFTQYFTERIWGDKTAIWFSPNGSKMAFATFEYEATHASCFVDENSKSNSLPHVSDNIPRTSWAEQCHTRFHV